MKFISSIPNTFKLEGKNPKNAYIFRDKDCGVIRLVSPIAKPFDKEWLILLRFDKQKSDRAEMTTGITLKLIPLSEAIGEIERLQIDREIYKSTFSYSTKPCKLFINFTIKENIQLSYTIFE